MRHEAYLDIFHFHCPRWSELPEQPLLSSAVVKYICQKLAPIMNGENAITGTMIQNYTKCGFLPKPVGKKYNREQIALLIVISIYKSVIDIKDIKIGVDLQLKLSEVENAYNSFAKALETALNHTFYPVVKQAPMLESKIAAPAEHLAITLLANAFALKLLSIIIIKESGYKNLWKTTKK